MNLNTRITIEEKFVTQDEDYGNEIINWTPKCVVWAEMQDTLPSKSESVQGGLAIASTRSRVRMRYRTDIDSSMRFTARGFTYQFVSEPAMIGRNQFMEFMAERYSS